MRISFSITLHGCTIAIELISIVKTFSVALDHSQNYERLGVSLGFDDIEVPCLFTYVSKA